MTDGDDDIAAALPRPPLPAPARREAAIAEALRRFDGAGPAPAGEGRRGPPASAWWPVARRPQAGALAGAFLVALVALPFVWTAFDRSVPDRPRERPLAVEDRAPDPAMADAAASEGELSPQPPAVPPSPAAADEAPGKVRPRPEDPRPAGAGQGAGEAPVGRSGERAADPAAARAGEILVTGTRIRNPELTSSSPVTVVNEETVDAESDDGAITVTGTRSRYAAPRRRGDWNACTVDDPGQSLAACRRLGDAAAKRASGAAAARMAEGLSQAWDGELEAAIASFDRAIELSPRSSAAYLNRALARRRLGDLDGALADLDRAVRFSPRAARYYFHRSLILRQRGDHRRAEADEERAVALDPRYAVAVKGGQ